MFADDEEWGFDDEPEIAVLKRAPVALPHEKADQPAIALAHFVRRLIEGDPGTVHHCQVRREGAVEGDEAVVKNRNGVLG